MAQCHGVEVDISLATYLEEHITKLAPAKRVVLGVKVVEAIEGVVGLRNATTTISTISERASKQASKQERSCSTNPNIQG